MALPGSSAVSSLRDALANTHGTVAEQRKRRRAAWSELKGAREPLAAEEEQRRPAKKRKRKKDKKAERKADKKAARRAGKLIKAIKAGQLVELARLLGKGYSPDAIDDESSLSALCVAAIFEQSRCESHSSRRDCHSVV